MDRQALAGSIVARRRGLRWATVATTSATLAQPFQLLPTVKALDERLAALDVAHGLEPATTPDLS